MIVNFIVFYSLYAVGNVRFYNVSFSTNSFCPLLKLINTELIMANVLAKWKIYIRCPNRICHVIAPTYWLIYSLNLLTLLHNILFCHSFCTLTIFFFFLGGKQLTVRVKRKIILLSLWKQFTRTVWNLEVFTELSILHILPYANYLSEWLRCTIHGCARHCSLHDSTLYAKKVNLRKKNRYDIRYSNKNWYGKASKLLNGVARIVTDKKTYKHTKILPNIIGST